MLWTNLKQTHKAQTYQPDIVELPVEDAHGVGCCALQAAPQPYRCLVCDCLLQLCQVCPLPENPVRTRTDDTCISTWKLLLLCALGEACPKTECITSQSWLCYWEQQPVAAAAAAAALVVKNKSKSATTASTLDGERHLASILQVTFHCCCLNGSIFNAALIHKCHQSHHSEEASGRLG